MTLVGFAACGLIEFQGLEPGDPMKLIYATDWKGEICGIDGGVKDKENAYFMATGAVVCVSSCPSVTDFDQFICQEDVVIDDDGDYVTNTLNGKCMYHVESTAAAYRCVPKGTGDALAAAATDDAQDNGLPMNYGDTDTSGEWFNQFLADLYTMQGYIFGFGLGVAVLVSFLYLYFLRIPGLMFLIIWGAVLSILFVLFASTLMLYFLAESWKDGEVKSYYEILAIEICMYILAVVTLLYLCLVLVLRKRIQLALGIIKEAGRALASMPNLIFLPVVQAVGVVLFLCPWFIYVLYLASSGDRVATTVYNPYHTSQADETVTYYTYEYSTKTKYAFLYMLFCWFWTSQVKEKYYC